MKKTYSKTERPSSIKHAQKESFLLREISSAFLRIAMDDSRLQGLFINRVQLSPDRGRAFVFFHVLSGGKEAFEEKFPVLVLYKPSLRSAVAKAMESRYTPEITFMYDAAFDKQQKVDDLIEKLKDEGKL
jgi:ribosome-binding factor A